MVSERQLLEVALPDHEGLYLVREVKDVVFNVFVSVAVNSLQPMTWEFGKWFVDALIREGKSDRNASCLASYGRRASLYRAHCDPDRTA
jgi:hypothetical protein